MNDLKAKNLGQEFVRGEDKLLPNLDIEKKKTEGELANIYGKKLSGVGFSEAELASVDSKLLRIEQEQKFSTIAIKKIRENGIEAVKEELISLKRERDALRPGESQLQETLRKKLGKILVEAQVVYNQSKGNPYHTEVVAGFSYLFDGQFPDGADKPSEYVKMLKEVEVLSKGYLKNSVIVRAQELEHEISVRENRDPSLVFEEIVAKIREDAAVASK